MKRDDSLTGPGATRREALKLAGGAAALGVLSGAMPTAARAAAPMLGVSRPSIYRFKLGAFEVTNILDGFVQGNGPHPTFGNNQTAEVVQEYAKSQGLPPTRMENPYVNTLVNTGKELVLFDAGNGKARMKTAGHLPDLMRTAGYKPEDVDIVVITHAHPDHMGGLIADGKPVYPNARYMICDREFDYWHKGENIPDARKANRELFMQQVVPLAEKFAMIKDGSDVTGGIRAPAERPPPRSRRAIARSGRMGAIESGVSYSAYVREQGGPARSATLAELARGRVLRKDVRDRERRELIRLCPGARRPGAERRPSRSP